MINFVLGAVTAAIILLVTAGNMTLVIMGCALVVIVKDFYDKVLGPDPDKANAGLTALGAIVIVSGTLFGWMAATLLA